MTVQEAREAMVCRVCGEPIFRTNGLPPIMPVGWQTEFAKMAWPLCITMNFGDEFAHTGCLIKENAP